MIKPLPPIDTRYQHVKSPMDRAKGGYSLAALERLLLDCEDQPLWRDGSDLCCLYYDHGGYYTAKQEHEYRQNGLEPRRTNLVGRVINGVLGQEAKSRRDPRIEPDDDEYADVADVQNVKLKEAQRETQADMAISNGYAGQVKAGLGWVEVSRNTDPFEYPYRVEEVHRSEIWWDWRAKAVDLRDARWLVRRQWKDLDEVCATWPEHREILEQSVGNWANWLVGDDMTEERVFAGSAALESAYRNDRSFRVSRAEWVDGGRRRVRLYEVWYRVPAQVVVMKVGARWVPVDLANPLHYEAVSRGLVKLEKRVTSQVRKAMFAGAHRLSDEATTKTRFPYIPFFAFRTDGDRTPYGLIHGMLAPQDEFNERRMRIQWMLKAQQLLIDSDALDEEYNNIEDIAATLMRPDMVAVLNKNRTNKDALNFRADFQLQKEQFEMMQDSKGLIQDVPGVYGPQLGDAPSGVTANSAMVTLVEQGIVAMGELNDNYGMSRRLVYEQLLELIAEDHAERDMQVAIGTGPTRRMVVLNTRDPKTGQPKNMVANAKVTTGLSEVPASPAYMAQMSQMMGNMIRNLAGTKEATLMLPAYVENTSAFGPGRKQLADDMRRMSGLPTTGDRQGAQAWQQQQQEAAARRSELEEKGALAEIEVKGSKAALTVAQTALAQAQTAATLVQTDPLADEPEEDRLIREALADATRAYGVKPNQPTAPQQAMQQPQQPQEAMPA